MSLSAGNAATGGLARTLYNANIAISSLPEVRQGETIPVPEGIVTGMAQGTVILDAMAISIGVIGHHFDQTADGYRQLMHLSDLRIHQIVDEQIRNWSNQIARAIAPRIIADTSLDQNRTIGITEADQYLVPNLTGNHTWKVTSSGATPGDSIDVSVAADASTGTHSLTLTDDGGGTIAVLQATTSAVMRVTLVFDRVVGWFVADEVFR